MFRIRQFATLAVLTAMEAIRQPISLLLLATCVVLTAGVPLVLMHRFGEEGRLVRDSGLAFHFVFGLLLIGYAAGVSMSREIRNGTASVVLSKPVGREVFFLSKFAGLAMVAAFFSFCAAAATLLSERVDEKFYTTVAGSGYRLDRQTGILLVATPFAACALAGVLNYLRRRPFASTAFWLHAALLLAVLAVSGCFDRFGRWSPYDLRVDLRIVPASALLALALVMVAAIALALSTRLNAMPTLTLCAAVCVLGLVSNYVLGQHADRSVVARVLFGLAPNWQHFWVSDAWGAGPLPTAYLWRAAGYAAAYSAGALAVGLALFRHVEMK
jgi:hypothetical protein